MDATDMMRDLGFGASPGGEAIRQIVQVFEAGCRAAAALRRTAEGLSPRELASELDSIELRMVSQIATICERFNREVDPPRAASGSFELTSDCLTELPTGPRN